MMTTDRDVSRIELPGTSDEQLRSTYIAAMARTAAAVTVVTTDGAAGRFGQTVSAATSVTADPPTLLVCLYRATTVAEAVQANGCFAVNVLGPRQRRISDIFAGRGRVGERYAFDGSWRSLRTGSPAYPGVPAVFDCVVSHSLIVGTHIVVVGRVVAAETHEAEGLTYRDRGYGRHLADSAPAVDPVSLAGPVSPAGSVPPAGPVSSTESDHTPTDGGNQR